MEISLVYIFNLSYNSSPDFYSCKFSCLVRKDQQQIALADISYLVVSLPFR